MIKVMVILANNCEEGETTTIIDVMRRAGFQCDGISIGEEVVTCQHGCRLLADLVMEEDITKYKEYDLMILPGGWGASDNMREDARVIELVKYFLISAPE